MFHCPIQSTGTIESQSYVGSLLHHRCNWIRLCNNIVVFYIVPWFYCILVEKRQRQVHWTQFYGVSLWQNIAGRHAIWKMPKNYYYGILTRLPSCARISVKICWLVGLDLFNDDTCPSGHISRPTHINVSQSGFHSLNNYSSLIILCTSGG